VRAIIYAAKSTADERGSIATQLEDCRRMAAREGWAVEGEYSDEAESAWSGDRGPDLAAAMAHAERIAPSVLVVQHSDRLARGDGRKARHLGEIYFWALKADVELHSDQDDSTFTNPLLAFAMGERNAEDSRRKSLAVQAGKQRRATNGMGNGGPRPYGYRYAGREAPLQVVAAEAVIVQRVFAEFVAGASLMAIARALQAEGVPTLRAKFWRHTTVSSILENPVYVGKVRHRDDVLDGAHDPIVSTELWQRASDLLTARPKKGRGRPSNGGHLFRKGMLRCECGETMVARTGGQRAYYSCARRAEHGTGNCDMPHLRRADIDSAVYRYFEQVGLDVQATRDAIAAAHNRKLAEVTALRRDADRDLQRASERLARVRRDYVDGRLDASDWAIFRDELSAEHDAARAAVERLDASHSDVQRAGALLDAEREMLGTLAEIRRAIAGEIQAAENVAAVRAALARLFEMFVVHRGAPERVHLELAGRLWIEPIVRERAVEGYSESLTPVLRREPLETIAAWSWPPRIFGAIEVTGGA
jgi:site-specific DNA recombinase